MSQIIDGKLIAQNLRNELKKEIASLKQKFNKVARFSSCSSW